MDPVRYMPVGGSSSDMEARSPERGERSVAGGASKSATDPGCRKVLRTTKELACEIVLGVIPRSSVLGSRDERSRVYGWCRYPESDQVVLMIPSSRDDRCRWVAGDQFINS